MESSTQENKERLLRMILKLKKKRKPAKVVPSIEIDNKPAVLFPANLETVWYNDKSDKIRQSLQDIIKKD